MTAAPRTRAEPKSLPARGLPGEEVLAWMSELRQGDARWRDGRVWCLVFHAGEELEQFLQRAYALYFSENGLNPAAFPSLRKFEMEVVSICGRLLGGGDGIGGHRWFLERLLRSTARTRAASVPSPTRSRPGRTCPVFAGC